MGFSLTLGGRRLEPPVLRYLGALERAGIEPGALIAFSAEPTEAALGLGLSLLEAQIPFLPLNPRASASERRALVERAGATWVEPELGPQAQPAWLARFSRETTAAVVATSGSSGEPKLCRLSRAALEASARASAARLGYLPEDRWLLCLPFAHVGGLSILTRALFAGRSVVAHSGFEPEALLELVLRERVSLLSAVPAMLRPLFDADHRGALARLRVLLVGGAACPRELRQEAAARGVPLLATYGLTEAASQVTTQAPGEARPDSLDSGTPLEGTEVRIREGRVEVRGPTLASGYLGEAPFEPGAFFTTGDLGELDERGRLHVLGRADDVIVTGGENVHPEPVERVLRAQPGVRDVLVFGTPDPRFGQIVSALLVLAPGVDLERTLATAAADLASWALPRRVAHVSALPLTPLGKPDRKQAAREPLTPWSPRAAPRGTRGAPRAPGSA